MPRKTYSTGSIIPGPLSVEKYLRHMLMIRAASKLHDNDVGRLLQSAKFALTDAGKWTDDVRVDVRLKSPFRGKVCTRLLHGVPSPRYWPEPAKFFAAMAAKDIIYFFATDNRQRSELLDSAMPEMNTADDLVEWLTTFSTTRFEKQLVNALVEHIDAPIFLNCPQHFGPRYVLKQIALIGAEIDCLAWFTGQKSMVLANAAPVWKPAKIHHRAAGGRVDLSACTAGATQPTTVIS